MRDGLASIDRRDRPQFYIVGTSGGTRAMKTNQSVPRLIHGVMSGKQKLDISVGGKPHSVLIPVCGVANLTQSRSRRVFVQAIDSLLPSRMKRLRMFWFLRFMPFLTTIHFNANHHQLCKYFFPLFIRNEPPPFMICLRPTCPPSTKRSRETSDRDGGGSCQRMHYYAVWGELSTHTCLHR